MPLTDLQSDMLRSVERFAAERIAPQAAAIDRDALFPRQLYRDAAELGLFGLWIPEAYGGMGPDTILPLMVSECFARHSATFALVYSNCGDGCTPIVHAGNDAIKKRFLPGIAAGELVPCFALSEPEAGSDAANIMTRAERRKDSYVLRGRKSWCTNGEVGDVFTIFAKTDPAAGSKGISAFAVPRDTPGLVIGKSESLIGLRGSPTTQLFLEDAVIPAENLLGAEGAGFKIAMISLDEARLNCAAMALGTARAALDTAVAYAGQRQQFGKPIIEHQGLQFLLSENTAQLAAARALWLQAVELLAGVRDKRSSTFAAMAKLVATEAAMRITTDAVQVLGGNGLSADYPVERMMRDVKAFEIFDGSSQIQKLLIGRYLVRTGLPFDET